MLNVSENTEQNTIQTYVKRQKPIDQQDERADAAREAIVADHTPLSTALAQHLPTDLAKIVANAVNRAKPDSWVGHLMRERTVRNAIARALDENDADFDVETLFETVKAEETGDPTIPTNDQSESGDVPEDTAEAETPGETGDGVPTDSTPTPISRLGERPARDHVQPPPRARMSPAKGVHYDTDVSKTQPIATQGYPHSEAEVKSYVLNNLDTGDLRERGKNLEVEGEGLGDDNYVKVSLETPKTGYQLVLQPRREAPIVKVDVPIATRERIDATESSITLKEVIRETLQQETIDESTNNSRK